MRTKFETSNWFLFCAKSLVLIAGIICCSSLPFIVRVMGEGIEKRLSREEKNRRERFFGFITEYTQFNGPFPAKCQPPLPLFVVLMCFFSSFFLPLFQSIFVRENHCASFDSLFLLRLSFLSLPRFFPYSVVGLMYHIIYFSPLLFGSGIGKEGRRREER